MISAQHSALRQLISRWPSEEARHWTEEFVPQLCANERVRAVVLFGSTVRDVEHASDLDVLYIHDGDAPLHRPAPLDVDVRCYAAKRVYQLVQSGHDLLGWAIRLGLLVCERESYWTHLVDYWAGKLPFPDAQVATDRAIKAELLARQLAEAGDADAAFEQTVSALTHRARAYLLARGVYPTSCPELPKQLDGVDERELSAILRRLLAERNARAHGLEGPLPDVRLSPPSTMR